MPILSRPLALVPTAAIALVLALGSTACDAAAESCAEGELVCSPLNNRVERCGADGAREVVATCPGNTCVDDGEAARCDGPSPVCAAGATRCAASGAAVERCATGGLAWETLATCTDTACVDDDGPARCDDPELVCAAGATRCAAIGEAVERCATDGLAWETLTTCAETACVDDDGPARCDDPEPEPVCATGATRCATSGEAVERCATDGLAWETLATCADDLACTDAGGSSACQICAPGTTRCGAISGDAEVCGADGLAWDTLAVCTDGSCELVDGEPACEFPCAPGATRCGPGGGQVQVCDEAGASYQLLDVCLDASCVTVGSGITYCEEPQICTPNATRCSPTAANVVERCDGQGAVWAPLTTCPGGLQCTGATGGGTCQSCVPGRRICGANNASVSVCNPQGTAFETEQTCTGSSCVTQDGAVKCNFPCVPGTLRCSALKNFLQECNASGTGVTNIATCTGNTCTEALGTASCQAPPLDCLPGETRCSPLGTIVEECSPDGQWATAGPCPDADCQALNGVADCAAPECAANTPFCGEDDRIYYCSSSGKVGAIKEECAAPSTCLTLDGVAQCVAPDVAAACTANQQFCGADGAIYYCGPDGQVSGVQAVCGEGQVCVVEGGAPMCLAGSHEPGPGGEQVCVVTSPESCVRIPRGGTVYGYVYAEVNKPACDAPSEIVRECGERMACVDGACASSVVDEGSPWFDWSCPLEQQLATPTALEADCRCFVNNSPTVGAPVCGRPYDRGVQGVSVGAGPRVFGLANGHYSGGFIDGDELVVAAYWGASTQQRGAVLAIDVDSGDRRLVSGDLGATTAGSGPAFSYAVDVRGGPDGAYYVLAQATTPASVSIFRVDPTTGARTLAWRGQDPGFGQCVAGDPGAAANGVYLQYSHHGFAVDAAGRFYLGYANPVRDGRGVVRISADGASCAFLTATGARADGLTRGAGPDLGGFVQGFTLHGGDLVVQTTQPKALVAVDLDTGDRDVLYATSIGGRIGERWAVWDAAREVFWTAGLMNSVTIVAFHPATSELLDVFTSCGDPSFPWYPLCPGAGPIKINGLNYGGMWLHPTNGNLLFAQDSVSIVELELATGNSVIRSL